MTFRVFTKSKTINPFRLGTNELVFFFFVLFWSCLFLGHLSFAWHFLLDQERVCQTQPHGQGSHDWTRITSVNTSVTLMVDCFYPNETTLFNIVVACDLLQTGSSLTKNNNQCVLQSTHSITKTFLLWAKKWYLLQCHMGKFAKYLHILIHSFKKMWSPVIVLRQIDTHGVILYSNSHHWITEACCSAGETLEAQLNICKQ